MEISNSVVQVDPSVAVAVQKQMLDQMRTQGAGLATLIASAPTGSVNSSSQGRFLDVRV
jgi:hypothetical protein